MKLKNVKKQELALVSLLEFVRLSAMHQKEATKSVIAENMKISEVAFSKLIQRNIRLAVRMAKKMDKSIEEVLLDFRQYCFENPPTDDDDNDDDDDADTDTEENTDSDDESDS